MQNNILDAALYDLLYLWANALIQKYCPCHIHKCNGEVICKLSFGPCCGECRYLTDEGCTVMSLQCKLYLCWEVRDTIPLHVQMLFKRMHQMMEHMYILPQMRESRTEWLQFSKSKRKEVKEVEENYYRKSQICTKAYR